jgi:peptidoglycan hydrolase CwlO-like protein
MTDQPTTKAWLPIVLSLIGIIVAGTGFVFARLNVPDRIEVKTMIQDDAPWTRDKPAIEKELEHITGEVEETKEDVKEIMEDVTGIRIEQHTIINKVDQLLERGP